MSLSPNDKTDICYRPSHLPSDRPRLVLCDSRRHHRHSQRPRHPQVQLQNGPQPPLFHPPGPDHSRPDLRPLWLRHLDPRHLLALYVPLAYRFNWEAGIALDRPRYPPLARAGYFADFWEMSWRFSDWGWTGTLV